MPTLNIENKELFEQFKKQLMMYDPVHFAEEYLTLEGKPFTLSGNGYKPFSDIYRYIGIRALEPNAKPVILVKGRQVGATTMASALEMYFMVLDYSEETMVLGHLFVLFMLFHN